MITWWNGKLTGRERQKYIQNQLANKLLPTWKTTFVQGDMQLGKDIFFNQSFEVPLGAQKAWYTAKAAACGLIAIPAVVYRIFYDIGIIDELGVKKKLSRDFSDLGKAVTCFLVGVPLLALRIASIALDPLRMAYWYFDNRRHGETALLLVDAQRGFMPTGHFGNGELPVENAVKGSVGSRPVDHMITLAQAAGRVFVSQDWHGPEHCSFVIEGQKPLSEIIVNGQEEMVFPKHCQANTKGAKLIAPLDKVKIAHRFLKGRHNRSEQFSLFGGTLRDQETQKPYYPTAAETVLKSRYGIKELVVGGVVTEICVAHSIEDALRAGFNITLVIDAVGCLDQENANKELKKLNDLAKELNVQFQTKTTAQVISDAAYAKLFQTSNRQPVLEKA